MSRTLFLYVLVIFVTNNYHSQTFNPDKKLKFGFDIGANYTFLQIERPLQPAMSNINALNGTGLRIGLVMDNYINKKLSFMPKAELSFNDARLSILNVDGSRETKVISPLTIEISSHLAIKLSDKLTKPYILIGPALKIPIPDKSNPRASEINATIIAIDLGFGIDRTLKYFNFSPEIRYSYGLNNITNSDKINKMHLHNISMVFIFKG